MNNQIFTGLLTVVAIIAGGLIGFFFGTMQNLASLRNKKLNEQGKLKSGWFVMPGSFSRVAILLIILVILQVALPIIFTGNIQWLVSVGVILGYGWTLLRKLREHSA